MSKDKLTIVPVSLNPLPAEVSTSVPSPVAAVPSCVIKTTFGEISLFNGLVACVSVKNEVLSLHRCHVGTLNSSMVSPREVFKTAIMQNAASIIIAHNHPSSNVEPSPEDIEVTKRLVESGQLLGIEVLDHLIVSNHRYLSLREKGFMM